MTRLTSLELERELFRPERRAEVINIIKGSTLSDAWKRALYLRWLLRTGIAYEPGDLDDVITGRRRAAPTPEELR